MPSAAPLPAASRTARGLALALLGTVAGCSAEVSGRSPPPSHTPDEDADGSAVELPTSRVWRLTPLQYERSFEAAFGTTHVTAADFVRDSSSSGFDDVAAQLHVDIRWAQLVQRNAAEVAAELAPGIVGAEACLGEVSPERTCVGALVDRFGARAFRRPVDATTREALVELFLAVRAGGSDAASAAAAVLEAIAQSPHFLYRVEIGEPVEGGVERLDAYTVASQLSYMLTDAPPDAELMAAAEDELHLDPDAVAAHARRLLASPEALAKVSRFFDQYLGIATARDEALPKDADIYPSFTPAIQAAMIAETDRFVERIAFAEDATMTDVFTSSETYVDDPLRAYYGWPGAATADAPFAIPGGERAGVFMQGSVLATRSASIKTDVLHRGLFVYERLLCKHTAPPDGLDIFEVADQLEPPDPESTERQKLEYQLETIPDCAGCHALFVPLGLSLETFDASGVHRTEQNGRPLDPSGMLSLTGQGVTPYRDALEMFDLIARSEQGQACFAQNWATYAFGAALAVPLTATLIDAFQASDLGIRELLVLVTQEDAFYFRRTEVSP